MAGNDFKAAVERLISKEPGWKPATAAPAKGPRPSARGTGRPASEQQTPAAADAFEESDYDLREYWPERVGATSSDGLFVFIEQPIKSVARVGTTPATFKEPT